MKRKEILLFFLFLMCFYVLASVRLNKTSSDENYKCPDCNVILITLDALRADHLTSYGYPKNTTPFLYELSKQSWLYSNAVSQSGSTEESISSLFTSKFPYTDGVMNLRGNDSTLTELLKENGYYTKAIVSITPLKSIFGFSKGFNEFDDHFDFIRRANETTDLAINWLKNNDKKPFFLWVHYKEPHSPYDIPKTHLDMVYEPFNGSIKYHFYTIYGENSNLSNEMIYNLTVAYDENIRFLDDNVEILFEYLNNSRLLDNSFIVITADHGESLGEHFIFDHNDLYYGIIHVPLILKHPNLKSKIIDQPVALVDVFPTIFDALDIKYNYTLRGKSLFSNGLKERFQFAEFQDYYTIIKDEWKLMRGYCKKDKCTSEKLNQDYERLFNIKMNPNETIDLKEINKDVYENLRSELDGLLNTSLSVSKSLVSNTSTILDEKTRARLRELGYIE